MGMKQRIEFKKLIQRVNLLEEKVAKLEAESPEREFQAPKRGPGRPRKSESDE